MLASKRLFLAASLMYMMVGLVIPILLGQNASFLITEILNKLLFCFCFLLLVNFIKYSELKEKCLFAAIFGYFVADFLTTVIWFAFEFGNYYFAAFFELFSVILFMFIYWFRSYNEKSDTIEDDSVYCLRRKPTGLQDLLIALFGCFGAYGGYAICVENTIYTFRRGKLRKYPVNRFNVEKYHITKGGFASKDYLESKVGTAWSLSANCLTLLRGFWHKNKKEKNHA